MRLIKRDIFLNANDSHLINGVMIMSIEVLTKVFLTFPSAKADITLPKAESDLLIFLASSRTIPSAPVLLT